ncbi:uncharacterized protein HD556DRAFT_1438436 [Suillus plorans]|uniref:MYND-type domain-containing protein n=1 Tax=Suillus plorans TaxID=116603 RepID=A0A9P7DRI2_9AGAM|nr:uncharacterized protein HD556DRAFT_1438436 [Suillus plorans]KAG1801405.1 hypothetical protein HD556DRAFT_1438436 [Suillus plorans]
MPTAADITRMTYKGAEQLRSEQRPGGDPSKLDFGIVPTCYNCDIPIMGRKPLICSGCRSAVFCSKNCHTANWKAGRFGAQGHKFFCAKNKVHMEKVPQVQALLKQFPWGRIETDGTFAEPIVRAYHNVLGAEGFGYWSIPGGSNPHLQQPSNTSGPSGALRVDDTKGFEHGYMLLSNKLLTDETGWKLEKRLIPRLVFELGTEPELASNVDIVDWDSWYKWRNIPKESPAALLLHYPLTVYQLLVNVLQVAGPKRSSSESRQALNVHYIGAEVELNMLPLFSELALLLPHTDIKMTFFGIAVHSIVSKAKKNSIAMKAKQNEPVYTYTSPASCGASTLSLFLHGDHENWDPRLPLLLGSKPDAIVGLNAGLTSYPAWQFVILCCHTDNTPFAVSEYAEQSAELQRDAIPQIIAHALPRLHSAGMIGPEIYNLTRPREYPIAFNPFQRPGQRNLGSVRLPNVPNGFTMRVVGGDEQEIIHPVSAGVPVPVPDMSELLQKTEQFSLNRLD